MKNYIDELLREHREQGGYFYSDIPLRFSDYLYNGEMHLSKCFDLFEMARFQILEGFRHYLNGKENHVLFNPLLFCVIKVDYKKNEPLKMTEEVRVKSYLTVDRVPILTFRQQLSDLQKGTVYNEANVKIALVDKSMHAVRNWRDKDLINILLYIRNESEKNREKSNGKMSGIPGTGNTAGRNVPGNTKL